MPALVIGAGPAGLMAAEELARAGHPVLIAEALPTPARKFLMAGKSGLNLTRDQAPDLFASHYTPDWIAPHVADFGPAQVRAWAQGLGIALFTGSTGRVFPVGMKAAPLLRAWLARLDGLGVRLATRWRWQGFQGDGFAFATPEGPQVLTPRVTVLALGGASWPRLGSDAAWVPWLAARGVQIAPFRPANMGLRVTWSAAMAPLFGQPVKGTAITDGTTATRGEFVIARSGIEGGGIYPLAARARDGAALHLDLMPDLTVQAAADRLARARPGESLSNRLRKRLRLDPARAALAREWGGALPADPTDLAARLKALPIRHDGPQDLSRAISSAGGITRDALHDDLSLRALPGVFAAGEMLDWEAPTGGYLLTGCFATGRAAGRAAARRLAG
ncbi:TIGR03862 family flavoprotein [Paracoccus sp. p4-l81]|uniref:TIGR03862 family flavoprotein n=1 Tax=Paracoccus sp. p4-l81 TaxID=3342806 RepID=UPI0035B94E72